MLAAEIPRRYDGSRRYSNSSSRYVLAAEIPRRYDGLRQYDVGLLSFQSGI
ncbi:hypothetical protein ACJZL1_03680 [Wolbachia endosymbiont of Rhagoletis indifferens]|uniref:hypothetical protein n=1 Tax=Wolbachia endosymbiont of Rhagoletis indifferens TaxID=3383250 RepID=UPI003AF3BC3D